MAQEPLSKIKILGAYQILGGLGGLCLFVYLLSTLSEFSLLILLLMAIIISLYIYSIFCGVLVFKDPLRGLKHSRINQILQIFSFSIWGYGFQYFSGIYLCLAVDFTRSARTDIAFGISSSNISFDPDTDMKVVCFNIVPILLLLFINRQTGKMRANEMGREVDEIEA